MHVSTLDEILKSDVSGQVVMRTFLSGMPECKLGLNDKIQVDASGPGAAPKQQRKPNQSGVELDDVQFHQCVKLGRFDQDRTISFIPPDGEFELMKYRTTDHINLPFRLTPSVQEFKTRVEYKIAIKSCFAQSLHAKNVVIRIPTPPNTAKAIISVGTGRAKYAAGENCLLWKISKFAGQEEFILSADLELSTMVIKRGGTWSRPPISLEFQVMMFTASGVAVQFLKVFERAGYKSVKWVRYYTKAGNYQVRF